MTLFFLLRSPQYAAHFAHANVDMQFMVSIAKNNNNNKNYGTPKKTQKNIEKICAYRSKY